MYLLSQMFCFIDLKLKYEQSKATSPGHVGDHDHDNEGLHSVIGIALVLGFVFMLIVDYIGSSKTNRGEQCYLN